MTTSRSTPRLRFTVLLLAGVLVIVAVSSRTAADGVAGVAMQLAGLACVACAALGRAWTSVFIAGFKDTQLVRHGPYAMLRHPLYALSLLAMLGIGLSTRSLVLTILLLAAFTVLHVTAARAEDRFLLDRHGAAFASYASEVRAFLPRWSAYGVPETLDVRPRVLWKAFLDAGTLLGLWALVVLMDAIQQAGRLPTWITLP